MPTYEYACEKCGHEFERQQRITDDPVKTCPVCKAKKVRRLISRTAFVLKGGGWYSDLYSSAKPGADGDAKADGDSSTPAAASASDAKSSEAKPETKDTTPKSSGGKGKGKSKGKSAKAA
jgi:putative FmdB family regulatory protein